MRDEFPSAQHQQFEADHTFKRLVELELQPVRGHFDTAHLKEVHRRIFQDLPGAGFPEVTPGEFRTPVPRGQDWMKQRGLSTMGGTFHVVYSQMDAAAAARLAKALEAARPDALRPLKTPEFTARFAAIYAELDDVHPFSDGNSRTFRTFTRQLAKAAGYAVDWERFARNDAGRDLLHIARDRSVNELAKPYVQHENTMRKILRTQERLKAHPALADALCDAVRPNRAVAFEQLNEQEALKEHPELQAAYRTLRAVAARLAVQMPSDPGAQRAGIQSAMIHVQNRLDAGETADFVRDPER